VRALYLFPSLQTIRRYVNLINQFGHCRPCRRTGNKRAEILRDHNIVFLVLFRIQNALPLRSMHFCTVLTSAMSTSDSIRVHKSQLQRNELVSQGSGAARRLSKHTCQSIYGRGGCTGTCHILMVLQIFEWKI
jgi:hypothetical protein